MIVKSVKQYHLDKKIRVSDCLVSQGYLQGESGSLPDVDIDFQSDRRQEVKEYLERRYNKNGLQRVFSAGTFTTMKLKAVLKDVARVHGVPVSEVNYVTSMIDDDSMGFADFFKYAFQKRRLKEFIQNYPLVIEDIRTIMGQPRSSSIHASAIIITPEHKDGKVMECFDYLPIKKIDDILVSEIDGYSIDEIGLLKNDCLGIKELAKLQSTRDLVVKEYGDNTEFLEIINDKLDDERAYELFTNGFTQNIFQFGSAGMTKFVMDMKPTRISDLIAANALFRPATIESGSTEAYVDCKNGKRDPVYLWGTHDILKETFAQLCIAEDSMVVTSNGYKKIQNVKIGDKVLTEDGTFQEVILPMYKGERDTLRVHTGHGEDLICTPDHKVLTQFGWVEAKDLKPNYHLIKGFWCVDENDNIGSLKDWCLGIYLANGHYGDTCNITCSSKESANIIAEKFNEVFDLDCVVYFYCRAWYVRLRYKEKSNKPNPFKEYIKSMNLDDTTCYDKSIPYANPSLMLLTGFVEGDGCVQNGLIRLSNKSLAYQLFLGFQSFRIHSYYYEVVENDRMVYCVGFNDNHMKKMPFIFKKHCNRGKTTRWRGPLVPSSYIRTIDLGSVDRYTRKNLRDAMLHKNYCYSDRIEFYGGKVDHLTWGRVLSVKPDRVRNVYDLMVDKNHSFCVGGLVVHNCYQEDLARMAREIGGFSLAEGVHLVKYISKKKVEKILSMKDKFMEGAKEKGCPDEDAKEIWQLFENAGSYLFNKCISGKESIMRPDKNQLTIEMMYNIKNSYDFASNMGYKEIHKLYNSDHGYGYGYSLGYGKELVVNKIVDIRYMGFREVFRITLDDGKTLDVTNNHKHPTQNGVKRTDDLIAGVDKMYVREGSWIAALRNIVSIESIGYDDVYDVEMADPNHTFCTGNGVVTCNSHATAYALTAYIGAWYKANYPTAFYTVALQYAKDDNINALMSEMELASNCRIVSPDINESGMEFKTDFKTDEIYWSLSRIKFIGTDTVRFILDERESNGPFKSIEDFCDRIIKRKTLKLFPGNSDRCPITSRHIKNLIVSGCFDKLENVLSVTERYGILKKASEKLGFEINPTEFPDDKLDKHYFWSMFQISISGIGSIDYDRVYNNSDFRIKVKNQKYKTLHECKDMELDNKRVVICATVNDFEEKSYTDKETGERKVFVKLQLQQNNELMEMTLWNDDYDRFKDLILISKGRIMIASVLVRWSDFSNMNTLQVYKSSVIDII